MAPAILGKKLGMTQLFDTEGRSSPVTLIEAGPCHVLQIRTLETDGYQAMQLGFDPMKKARITKPQAGHAAKTNGKPMYYVREFRLMAGETVEPGSTITVGSFEGVKLVDVVGTTKGTSAASAPVTVPNASTAVRGPLPPTLCRTRAFCPARRCPATWATCVARPSG